MSLEMVAELIDCAGSEAEQIIERARVDGASVVLAPAGVANCRPPAAVFERAHDALADNADWNADTWAFNFEDAARLASDVRSLYDASKRGITLRALWAGDTPLHRERARIEQVEDLIKSNRIGTRTVYSILKT